MVYKVSKGGVRSGNTLRGLHSRRTRRYSRQACVVGRSNLSPKDVPTFLESHIEDPSISSSLGSTDVALSLNKKKRWLLPATVGHMIKTGSFKDEKTMVSLLERHKLKRRANCVSFVCNQGRIRHVTPRQKRYFSFNLENIDNNLSNRQIKRQKAEIMKQAKPKKVKITKDKNNGPIKTLEVFTVSGSGKVGDARKLLVSSKPEYRLEVFYPCPQTCSLAYNPKYTNVHMEFGEEGAMELKSEKKVMKKGRRHRKRFTLKDLEAFDPEIVSSDEEEFWDDDPEEFKYNAIVSNTESSASFQEVEDCLKTSFQHSLEEDNKSEFDDDVYKVQEHENILASLITQAEKARSLCENNKPRRRRKQSSNSSDDQNLESTSHEKSHIVYTSEVNPRLRNRNRRKKTTPTITTTNYVTLNSGKVILKSVEATPGNLRAKFGRFYAEAESEPRRFLIDVTEDVQNLLCTHRDTEQSAVYTSFLVFVHDGVYDEGLDTYKVIFNSNCCTETRAFKTCFPFEETSFEKIMNRVASAVIDMKEDNLLDFSYQKFCGDATIPLLKFVNDHFKVKVKTFRACDEIRRVSQTEVMQENVDFSMSLDSVVRKLDFEIFCDICYENINPTQTWDLCGTKLSKCSHIFCDDCWRSHFRAKLKDGSVKMECPGYGCDETVGPVTLLSLLHVSEVSKLFQRKFEEEAESSSNSRWCPNVDCGRVIKLDIAKPTKDMSLDVTCSCGQEFCFSCLSHPHWPATCDQAEKYDEKLQTLKSLTKSTDDPNSEATSLSSNPAGSQKPEILEVEGRLCPKCSKFIEKNGGCPHMSCKCGHNFCWACLKDYDGHTVCIPNSAVVFEHTLKLKVRHLLMPLNFSPYSETTNKLKPDGSRQRTTLYKKAIQERQEVKDFKYQKQVKEMVKKIVRVSQKDLRLKKEILSICGQTIDDTDTDNLRRCPMVSSVSKFLRSCCAVKRALHHVAEFTFVLLQDAPDSVDKRRALRLANDLSGYCSFIKSILEAGQKQDVGTAVKRLSDIQMFAKRALTVLLSSVGKLKC